MLVRSVWLLAATLAILAAGCADSTPVPVGAAAPLPKDAAKRGPVGCAIKGDPTCEVGKAPNITVTLTNLTDADIYLVGSLDASDSKRRYPHCSFEVTGPDGKPAVQRIARCAFMNTLRAKDFIKVSPGEAFDPFQSIDDSGFFSAYQLDERHFRMPGVYRIRFVYSTKNDDIKAWAGDGAEKVAADDGLVGKFKQTPKFEVHSDEFTLTVVGPRR
jgi:hypothetical protein